jgi:hypothetical protein
MKQSLTNGAAPFVCCTVEPFSWARNSFRKFGSACISPQASRVSKISGIPLAAVEINAIL